MCGICGIVSLSENHISEKILKKMTYLIHHRGPDDEGYLIDRKVGMGFKRLSIIDLKYGHQPMSSDDQHVSIIFNGEIYNHLELRAELEQKGVKFKTKSDTEVVLECYRYYGVAAVEKLDGMFAIMIYDKVKKRVILLRDKVGKKPFYIFRSEGFIYLSSELKSFSAIPDFRPKIDYEVLDYTFSFRHSPRLSPFSNVEMLAHGHYIEIELENKLENYKCYFSFTSLISEDLYRQYSEMPEKKIEEIFEENLVKSVKKRLMADVPVVSINSGGLDSSIISAIASKYIHEIILFHINVKGSSETEYANLLKNSMNSKMHVINFDSEQFYNSFEEASHAYEYYMVHPNNVAMYLLSKEINRQGFKVVLGGEAADEILGGYTHLNEMFRRKLFYYKYAFLRNNIFIEKVLKKAAALLPFVSVPGVIEPGKMPEQQCPKYIKEQSLVRKFEFIYNFIKDEDERRYKAFVLYDYVRYLQPLFLRGDKMFSANSVELRLPFADLDLLKITLNLPYKYVNDKRILRNIGKRYIPVEILNRPKIGFSTPFSVPEKFLPFKFHGLASGDLSVRNQISLLSIKIFIEKFFRGYDDL